MVATASTMRALGTAAPDFSLRDVVSGNRVSLVTFAGKDALLVMFISRHCPYVQHVKEELARIGKDYSARNVGIVGISSNDILTYPDDAPEKLKEMAQETGCTFPICHDETQEVAKAYTAACTPDIFLFDRSRKLAYRGQLRLGSRLLVRRPRGRGAGCRAVHPRLPPHQLHVLRSSRRQGGCPRGGASRAGRCPQRQTRRRAGRPPERDTPKTRPAPGPRVRRPAWPSRASRQGGSTPPRTSEGQARGLRRARFARRAGFACEPCLSPHLTRQPAPDGTSTPVA